MDGKKMELMLGWKSGCVSWPMGMVCCGTEDIIMCIASIVLTLGWIHS